MSCDRAAVLPFRMTRRHIILGAVCCALGGHARAASRPGNSVLTVDGRSVDILRYRAPGYGKRPTVLLLHGSKGLDAQLTAYDRYARELADANIDALLFTYMRPEELAAIDAAAGASGREAEYARSVDRWVSLVRGIAADARDDELSSGHVGLLGFSLGGLVAVAAASQPLFSVLTVFYAGLPGFYRRPIRSLPPLLEIHGDRDRSVSLKQGSTLVSTARGLGGVADQVVFHGEGHGFDLDIANPDAASARRHAVAFISEWIGRQ